MHFHNCNLQASRAVTEFDLVFEELVEAETQGETCVCELPRTENKKEVVLEKLKFCRAVVRNGYVCSDRSSAGTCDSGTISSDSVL